MALIVCIECGKSYSDKARQCPECGCPTQYSLENCNKDSFSRKNREDETICSDSVRREVIEKIMEQIRLKRAKPVKIQESVQTFHIDDWTFRYADSERLFFFLYNSFHRETDAVLKKYKENFLLDVKAVSMFEIKALEKIFEKCNKPGSEFDPAPFANEFVYKISDYRDEKEDEEGDVTGIDYSMESAIERAGENIMKALEEDGSIAPSIEPSIRIVLFYLREIQTDYYNFCKNTIGNFTLKKYIELFWSKLNFLTDVQKKYKFVGDCFEKYAEIYPSASEDVVTRAKKEIQWRKAYLENPEKNKLWEQLAVDVECVILFLIQSINEACRFGINPDYYNWNMYQEAKRNAAAIYQTDDDIQKKRLFKKSFLQFPFASWSYKHLLEIYGDADGETERVLKLFAVQVQHEKAMLFNDMLDNIYTNIDWKNVMDIKKAYYKIQKERNFLRYEGTMSEKETKVCEENNDYMHWEQLVKENHTIGLAEIKRLCKLLIDELGMQNYAESDKVKKGFNIGVGSEIYFAYDNSMFKNGKNGFAITNQGIYVREMFSKPKFMGYNSLKGYSQFIKYSGGGIFADTQVIFYYSGDVKVANKLCEVAKYIILAAESVEAERSSKIFCAFCGKQIDRKAKFCSYCGQSVQT